METVAGEMSVAHICPIPRGSSVGGVAFYLVRLADAIASVRPSVKQLIYCQKGGADLDRSYQLEVLPSWNFGFRAFWQVDRALAKTTAAIVHVQYEVSLFGSVVASLTLPFFIKKWRRRGFRVVVTLHHVISPSFNVTQLRLWKKPAFYDYLILSVLRAVQKRIVGAADVVVVHELSHLDVIDSSKAVRIPLFV
jgi:hypothetical protein